MGKKDKSKEDRLKEGLSLLNQLKTNGVRANSLSFLDLRQKISLWIETGDPWDGTVPFPEYQREAIVSLPKYDNRAAGINFKVKKVPQNVSDSE
jgi:hypothetical protein